MTFRDIKQGYNVFIFDRKATTLNVAKVVSASAPRHDIQMGGAMDMVIDITVDCEGKTTTYVVKENACIGSAGSITISVDRDTALMEVEGEKAKAQSILNTMEDQKRIIDNCNTILVEYNPALKKEQEADKRMAAIESKLELLLSKL